MSHKTVTIKNTKIRFPSGYRSLQHYIDFLHVSFNDLCHTSKYPRRIVNQRRTQLKLVLSLGLTSKIALSSTAQFAIKFSK